MFERLQNHPECMEAIERLAETVKVSAWEARLRRLRRSKEVELGGAALVV